ncbi:MAG: HEAT repeat domain-containing protein, partial [Chloroflexi bacterium]|nr:HEAT repeat domain-containing protein [Chloroflexota bacterium]
MSRVRPRDEFRYFGETTSFRYRPHPLPGDIPHYPRNRVVDVEHLKLEVSLDLESKRVIGRASITASPINDGATVVELDAADMLIGSARLADGAVVQFQAADSRLSLTLPAPRKAGESFTLIIDYQATPRKGLYFTGPDAGYPHKPVQVWTQGQDEDNHHWFPCHDFPNDRFTSEVLVTVPLRWWAISNGRLASVKEDARAGTRTFHWVQDKPHVAYLMTLCAGEFSRIQEEADGTPVEYYVPPGREEDGKRAFGNTPEMLKLFNRLFGVPYPWAKYAQVAVQDFIFGGMENTSATTQTDLTLHDQRAHLDFSSDPLVSHELAHQWFGDLLTYRDWSHGWLGEGFATFFEAVWREHHLGVDEYKYDIYTIARAYFQEDSERYRRPIVSNIYYTPTDIFDRHLYEKGALALHMLRHILGEEQFWKTIRHYARKHQNSNVITADFQRAIEEATGKNLDWFFDQWVYKGGHPQFKVSYEWDQEQRAARLTVTQTQQPDALTPLFRVPVQVAFATSQGRQTFSVELSEKQHTLHFPLPERPLLVQFDPGYGVLKALDFERSKDVLLYQVQHDEDIIGRIEAAQGLGKLGSQDAVEVLRDVVLKDGFWGVQAEAARALGTIKFEASLNALLECTKVGHPKARRAVATALGEFRDDRAAEALVGLLDGDESYYVAGAAASSLGKTRSARAFDALVRALGRDSHMEVIRSMALEGLAELRDERALPVALGWTAYGRPARAREAATSALGKLGEG